MDRYMPGVPCWIDTNQPDPAAAADFYAALFGWECEDMMPPDAGRNYFIARIDGKDAAAIASNPGSGSPPAVWNTYIRVESADAAAEKVREAGGTVSLEPFDVFEAGRMAVLLDPEGAEFCAWEANKRRGAEVVNSHGSVNFNDLHASDVERAKAFYGAVFGWSTIDMGGGNLAWTQPGYGDLLEQLNPGTRERNAAMGAPAGFEDVVASLQPAADGEDPYWGVTFGIDDADEAARVAAENGGTVLEPPADAPWVRTTLLADPAGATFLASQFKPENKV